MGYPNQSDVCEAKPVKRGLFEIASAANAASAAAITRSSWPRAASKSELTSRARLEDDCARDRGQALASRQPGRRSALRRRAAGSATSSATTNRSTCAERASGRSPPMRHMRRRLRQQLCCGIAEVARARYDRSGGRDRGRLRLQIGGRQVAPRWRRLKIDAVACGLHA